MIATAAGDVKSGGGGDDDVQRPSMLEQLRVRTHVLCSSRTHARTDG